MGVPALTNYASGVGAINANGLNTFIQGGSFLANLQTFVGTQNMTVYLIGGTQPADGQQGYFYWNSTWTGTPDNVTTIQPYGLPEGAWIRIPNTSITASPLFVSTRAAFALINVPSTIQSALLSGLNAVGDSPLALYVRVSSEPSFPGRVQTLDGGWWAISGAVVYPQQIGSTGTSNDATTLGNADLTAAAIGAELVIDQVHAITSATTFTTRPRFAGGGRIKPASVGLITFDVGYTSPPTEFIFDMSSLSSGSGLASVYISGVTLTPYNFGAAGNNTTVDDAGVDACFKAMIATGCPINLCDGQYLCNTAKIYDITARAFTGFTIYGDGMSIASLNFPNISTGKVVQFYMNWTSGAALAWYRPYFKGFSIIGNTSGSLFTIARDDFNDQCNVLYMEDFGVFNPNTTDGNDAVRLNGIYSATGVNVNFNAYASPSVGTPTHGNALRCRNVNFATFNGGSIGNGSYGVVLIDGSNQAIVLNGVDIENIATAISVQQAFSNGVTAIGCWMSQWTSAALSAPVSRTGATSIRAIECIFPTSSAPFNNTIIDPSNSTGIVVQDLSGSASSFTPTFPTTGTTVTNTNGKSFMVTIEGTITSFLVDGLTILVNGSVNNAMIRPSSAITINYSSGSPTWYWFPIS